MTVMIRLAEPVDVSALFHVRTSVRENHVSRERLAELSITDDSVSEMIYASPCAWVAVLNDEIVGFSMIDVADGSLFAVFVLPAHEGKGLGTQLVLVAEDELFKHHSEIWLETDKDSRAAGFYRHLGWAASAWQRETKFGSRRHGCDVSFWRNAVEDAFRPVADIKRRRENGLLCLHHPRKARWGSAPKAYVAPMRFRNSATQLCWSAIRRAGPTARAMRPPSPAGPPQARPWTDRPRGNATASCCHGLRSSRS